MKIDTGVILVAGRSSRFGGDDKNSWLIQYNINLLLSMKVKNIIIVTNESNYMFYYENFKNIAQIFIQDKNLYGPASPIITIKDYLKQYDSPFYVILGDNYIEGPLVESLNEDEAFVSYRDLEYNEENLRLGYIDKDGKILEKPHNYKEGRYFIGYMAFHNSCLENLESLKKSERGEYEITEFYNSCKYKKVGLLDCNWFDITKKEDLIKIKNI